MKTRRKLWVEFDEERLTEERDAARRLAKVQQDNARSLGQDIAKLIGHDARDEDGDALRAAVKAVVRERDELRAQVDAARAECKRIHDVFPAQDSYTTASEILEAMDEAKARRR